MEKYINKNVKIISIYGKEYTGILTLLTKDWLVIENKSSCIDLKPEEIASINIVN